jgi:DNA processing protein
LLRQGALLCESAEDVLREVAPHLGARGAQAKAQSAAALKLSAAEGAVFGVLDDGPLHIDEVVTRAGRAPSEVLQVLLALELRGIVEQLPGKRFARRGRSVRPATET